MGSIKSIAYGSVLKPLGKNLRRCPSNVARLTSIAVKGLEKGFSFAGLSATDTGLTIP
jgi:hypothetical protein